MPASRWHTLPATPIRLTRYLAAPCAPLRRSGISRAGAPDLPTYVRMPPSGASGIAGPLQDARTPARVRKQAEAWEHGRAVDHLRHFSGLCVARFTKLFSMKIEVVAVTPQAQINIVIDWLLYIEQRRGVTCDERRSTL